jgi:hypothetical protein
MSCSKAVKNERAEDLMVANEVAMGSEAILLMRGLGDALGGG